MQTPLNAGFGCVAQHQVGEADDGVERGADFMAHVGQEAGLCPVGVFCLFFGQPEFKSSLFDHGFEPFAVALEFGFSAVAFGHIGGKGQNMRLAVNVDQGCGNFYFTGMAGAVDPAGRVAEYPATLFEILGEFRAQLGVGPQTEAERGLPDDFLPRPAKITQENLVDVDQPSIVYPGNSGR